jgi:hypothetical protein
MLGTGWAAARLASDINPKAFDLIVRCCTRLAAYTGFCNATDIQQADAYFRAALTRATWPNVPIQIRA